MMRITNSMMTSNTKNNINLNKLNEDKVNTQMATGQKISRPSDDPVVAIRALRFNTNISQLNQYHDKNIPDATAWLKVTETALKQTNSVFDAIKENLTTGASDTNTAEDRQKILESLKGLKNEIYAAGNADYAGRTVFTGYRTGESLTFLSTDQDLKDNYKIHQVLSYDDIETMTYVTSVDVDSATASENDVEQLEVSRIRLPYDNLNEPKTGSVPDIVIYDTDPTTGIKTESSRINVQVVSIAGMTQQQIDDVYKSVTDHSALAIMIPETGEIIMCDHVKEALKDADNAEQEVAIEYNKNEWNSGDLRPEHYFACVKTDSELKKDVQYNYYDEVDKSTGEPTGNKIPDFRDQDLEIEVAYNQKLAINTHASDVYTHDMGRDIDDLVKATQDVVDLDEQIAKTKNELSAAKTDAEKEKIQTKLDALEKEFAFKRDKMQKMFSNGLDKFDAYADKNNVIIADIGSTTNRLTITLERVADQLQSFTELADSNINVSLTDTAIDLKNAQLALEAAQMAAGKISQQTLLNYL